jgi:hypothetical protein
MKTLSSLKASNVEQLLAFDSAFRATIKFDTLAVNNSPALLKAFNSHMIHLQDLKTLPELESLVRLRSSKRVIRYASVVKRRLLVCK